MLGMDDLMRQAQSLQAKIKRLQQDLEERVYEGRAGGGVVKAFVNGKKALLKVEISPDVLEGGDKDMVEDLIVAAVEEAQRKAEEAAKEEMRRLTGSLPIPPGLLPF